MMNWKNICLRCLSSTATLSEVVSDGTQRQGSRSRPFWDTQSSRVSKVKIFCVAQRCSCKFLKIKNHFLSKKSNFKFNMPLPAICYSSYRSLQGRRPHFSPESHQRRGRHRSKKQNRSNTLVHGLNGRPQRHSSLPPPRGG